MLVFVSNILSVYNKSLHDPFRKIRSYVRCLKKCIVTKNQVVKLIIELYLNFLHGKTISETAGDFVNQIFITFQ
jgi:hypothetical protein